MQRGLRIAISLVAVVLFLGPARADQETTIYDESALNRLQRIKLYHFADSIGINSIAQIKCDCPVLLNACHLLIYSNEERSARKLTQKMAWLKYHQPTIDVSEARFTLEGEVHTRIRYICRVSEDEFFFGLDDESLIAVFEEAMPLLMSRSFIFGQPTDETLRLFGEIDFSKPLGIRGVGEDGMLEIWFDGSSVNLIYHLHFRLRANTLDVLQIKTSKRAT